MILLTTMELVMTYTSTLIYANYSSETLTVMEQNSYPTEYVDVILVV